MSDSGRMLPAVSAAVAVAAVAAAAVLAMADTGQDGPSGAAPDAPAAVNSFFDRYVAGDGRVVRRDQGGDTVSEGQAYAMLMAAATRDRKRFERVWAWARDNLQRDDGLLAFHWRDGRVADPQPATDADLDAAHALILAGRRFGRRGLRREGLEMASAILAKETVLKERPTGARGGAVGPRRDAVDQPQLLLPARPSRCSAGPRAIAAGARCAAAPSRSLRELTRNSPGLPPDWARPGPPGQSRPAAAPGSRSRSARFGYDAVRVPLRWAWACSARERNLATRPWDFLHGQAGGGIGPEYSLDGKRLAQGTHPGAMVAGAAAATSAGERGAAGRLLDRAAGHDSRWSTYYGSALLALGRLVLESRSLYSGCGARARGR